nr:putative late blight resistance protein homolog R1A-3 [Ipomoea trifida]
MDYVFVSSLLGIVDQLQVQLLLLLQKPPHNNNNLPDDAQIILSTLKDKLHFLQAYLDKPKPKFTFDPDREAVKRVDEEIRDVAMKAEDEIESKLGEIYQLQGEGVAVKACEDLHRILEKLVKDFECVELENVRDGVSSSSSNYDLENTMIGMEAVQILSRYFPRNNNGSRVLITTRDMSVAKFASTSDMWIFYTTGLNPEESWTLLSRTATSNGKWSSEDIMVACRTGYDKFPEGHRWFKVTGRDSRTTNFTKAPNLKELGIYIEGEVLPNALDNLAQLHQLEKLKVKMGRVERFNLPNCFPSNLKQLTLSNTYLSWEDMDIIGKLPNLDLLKLKDFAVCGPKWTPRDGEFLQLRFFVIERSDLEHWNANANHFPVLERLVLRYCLDLEKLPNNFEEVYTFRLIELDNCCSSLVTSAMEIQQMQRDLGYEGLVVRDVTKVSL